MAGQGSEGREFVSRILELAIADSTQGWLSAVFGAADIEVGALRDSVPDELSTATTLIAGCHHGDGDVTDGLLTGRWPAVVGARYADWLLLPARNGSACRLLVPRDSAYIDAVSGHVGLHAAGVADVTISDVAVDRARMFRAEGTGAVLAGAGAAAAVVGSAVGLWHRHVEQQRAQLAASYGGDERTDAVAAHVARAASDIDAARLQITESPMAEGDLDDAVRVCRQAVARARSAADRLLEHSRHALDASNPVTHRWRDVDAGSRLAVRLLHGLAPPLG